MILALLVLVLILGLAFLPQFWVRRVISRHAAPRSDLPGDGGSFARHLLDRLKLTGVAVEKTPLGDHYDPDAKAVRLSPENYAGRSLSAIVIAAHEVGHAIQDADGYGPLKARTRLARQAQRLQTIGVVVMMVSPIALLIFKSPILIVLQIAAGLLIMGISIAMHVTTLPVEFDASFKRALPILSQGGYLQNRDLPAARDILRAAAFTYVAAAAMTLLDIARWIRVLRF